MAGIAVKYNDDGEPQGTAGVQILKTILEDELSNVLVVVTRYFGGTLLGTGGLQRAYSSVTKKALDKAVYIEKAKGYEIEMIIAYSEQDQVKYYLKRENIRVTDEKYLDNITLKLEVTKEKFTEISNKNEINFIKNKIIKEKNIDI